MAPAGIFAPISAARATPGQARGPGWWLSQPWFELWHQEQHRWSEDYARMASEREARNSLVASMPPDVRAAYDAAQKASYEQLHQALELSTVEQDVLCLHQKHGHTHRRWQASPPRLGPGEGRAAALAGRAAGQQA